MKNIFLIVNFNDSLRTKHLVDNIINYNIIDNILIVDNNSNKEEKEMLKNIKNTKVEIIYNDDNLGYSYAINIGAKYLETKYKDFNLFISNSDIVVFSEQDLIKMVNKVNDPSIGVVGCHILERGLTLKGRRDIKLTKDYNKDLPIIKYFIKEDIEYYPEDHYKSETSIVDIISTCFFLLNIDTLKKIGYMDENIFLYYEDNILCKKVRNLGLNVLIVNDVKVKHLFGTSISKLFKNKEKRKILYESMYYYHVNYNIKSKYDKFMLKLYKKLK